MKKNVFGYTSIRSNSINSIHNNFQNIDELRKELQGRRICPDTIEKAMSKVKFAKYHQMACVHSFFPDRKIAYVGINGAANVVIKWKSEDDELLSNIVSEMKEIKSMLQ